jgi:MFS transporter, YNFM family, putative membrane transport protein
MAARSGAKPIRLGALGLTDFGLPLLLASRLDLVITGMALVGAGIFSAQAVATGFVGRAAATNRGAASGIYLACYFAGGLTGTSVLGWIFDRFGWAACVSGIGLALAVAALLLSRLEIVPVAAQ